MLHATSQKRSRIFVPKITAARKRPSAPMLEWSQALADEAYARLRTGAEGLETQSTAICAAKGPVAPHRDTDGTQEGMRIYGLVLRSDGHRLHSDALHMAGRGGGLPLAAGDVYEIDPFDRHWTTVPDGAMDAQLVFSVCIMHPDGRNARKMAHDLWWEVLTASIEAKHGFKARA